MTPIEKQEEKVKKLKGRLQKLEHNFPVYLKRRARYVAQTIKEVKENIAVEANILYRMKVKAEEQQ